MGWQIDLYGAREWIERGGDSDEGQEAAQDTSAEADMFLAELPIPEGTLQLLDAAGYKTLLDIVDLDRDAFLAIEGVGAKGVPMPSSP